MQSDNTGEVAKLFENLYEKLTAHNSDSYVDTFNKIQLGVSEFVNAPTTLGLEELSEQAIKDLREDLETLQISFSLLISHVASIEELVANRDRFSVIHYLLKSIAVSSINLMDSESPTLPRLKAENIFDIEINNTRFKVF